MKKTSPKKKASKEYKIIVVGEFGVGKASIISEFAKDNPENEEIAKFTEQYRRQYITIPDGPTVALEIYKIPVNDMLYKDSLKIFYKGANAAILVFDITNEKSFERIQDYWLQEVKKNTNKKVVLALAANKTDL